MYQLTEFWETIQVFMESGGSVLTAIFAVTLLMWTMILERMWYFALVHPRELKKTLARWQTRLDRESWCAEQIRRQEISILSLKLNRSLLVIKTLVATCPLLGLLGTVTGMIEVFDVMALVGSGNARAMASGVSLATIPTMAGMVAALSGLYFSARLEKKSQAKMAKVQDLMAMDRGDVCAAA